MNQAHRTKVGVIFGGRSGEHEVSLASARSVLAALNPDKYEVIQIGITHTGTWMVGEDVLNHFSAGSLGQLQPAAMLPDPSRRGVYTATPVDRGMLLEQLSEVEVIFPVLHGTYGEDGTLQGLLELAEMAYVGAGVTGSAVGMDKAIFKRVMQAHNLPVVAWELVLRSELERDSANVMARCLDSLSLPLFVKPANLGSSVGITKCQSSSDLLEGLLEAARFDRRLLVERGLEAREIEVSVLGNDDPQASIPGEIVPAAEFYTYAAKYADERSQLLIPAPLSADMSTAIRELAVQAYQAIDCAGMARVDFLLDRSSDEIFINELNTIPGFTEISMYPKLWEASGLPYPQLLDRLIELALERRGERARTEYRI